MPTVGNVLRESILNNIEKVPRDGRNLGRVSQVTGNILKVEAVIIGVQWRGVGDV